MKIVNKQPVRISDNAKLAKFIRRKAGKTIFRCTFTKRTTGEKRVMVCRLEVAKNIKGVGQPFDADDHELLTVWDMQKQAYRMINLQAVTELKIRGTGYSGRVLNQLLQGA